MKKIPALIIIGLLCFSMFSVLLPKVKAESVTLETLWTTPVTDNTSFVSDIGDVNGNGNPEVAVLDAHWPTGPATVQVLKNDGTTLWITSINFAGTGIAVEDTNLDGNAEVYVFGTTGVPPHYGDPIIACFDANGNQLWQFTRHETSPWSRGIDWVSFVNLDLDPQLEIFCGGGGWADYINYAFDTNGALMWTFTTRDIGSDWKIGDVNGDGADEIVLFTFQEVYILSKSGTLLRTIQPHTTSAWAQGALGDVNGDGVAEIVDSIKSYDISYNFVNTLFVYKGDGTLLWQKNYPQNPDGTPMNPILVDLTGDGIQDVVVLANKLINAYKNDGTLLWTFSDINPTRPWEVFITNFDLIKGDNKDEILFQCDQGLYILSLNGELIQRFDVPNQGRWVQSGHIGKDPRVDNLYYEFGDINNDGTNELIMDEVIDGQHYVAVGSLERPLGGLVGYWKFDEGSGSVAYDSSGYGNDGTIYGATWVDGIKGKALHFDGVDDWVRILSTSSISGLSQITLEAWIKEDSVATTVKGIISKCTGIAHPTYDAEYYLGLYGQDLAFHVSNYNYIAHDTVSGAINEADRWYHVAATWSGDSYTIYVDGVPRKSGTCTPQTTFSNTVDLQIGRHGSWSWVYFHGVIDEVMIYNYARTAEEIKADYNLGAYAPSAPRNLKAESRFSEVRLTWEEPSDVGISPILNYKIYRGVSPGSETFLASVDGTALEYLDSVSSDDLYYYYVTAENSAGEGPASNEVKCSRKESIKGIETVVSIKDFAVDGDWFAHVKKYTNIVFTVQQNFIVPIRYDPETRELIDYYWVQNVIEVQSSSSAPSPTNSKMTGVFQIWENIKIKGEWYNWVVYTEEGKGLYNFKDTVVLRSTIQGISLVLENDFQRLTLPIVPLQSFIYFDWPAPGYSLAGAPEIVIVGPPTVKRSWMRDEQTWSTDVVPFISPTSGHVDNYVLVGYETWLNGELTIASPIGYGEAMTAEKSIGLEWSKSTGDFNYNSLYYAFPPTAYPHQGFWVEPNYEKPLAFPPNVPSTPSPKKALKIHLACPAYLSIFDSFGRHVGYNLATDSVDAEIPDVIYLFDKTQRITIFDSSESYELQVIGTGDGDYTLEILWQNENGETSTLWNFSGTISTGRVLSYTISTVTPEPFIIMWEYVFKDPKRGTMLKVSTDDKFFQFIAPDKDFGIKCDADMKVLNHVIIICYEDSEMRLVATAVNDKIDFCSAIAWDKQTRKCYLLIDKPNLPRYIRCHFFI